MRTPLYKILYTITFIIGFIAYGKAQVLPVGTPVLEDYYRRQQLLGKIDSTVSFSIRPLNNAVLQLHDIYDPDSVASISRSMPWHREGVGLVQLLPIIWQHQYTSAFPTGYNDGAMIPNVGYQTFFSAGVFAQYKFLSIQLRPELVYAQNSSYPIFTGGSENAMRVWYDHYNNIDMPTRFGNGSYTRLLPGQSSIRANFDPVSVGISTENIWWGPGLRNSLLMSNTAPGFPHITVNSTRPIRSNIGSFEGQVIAGRLSGSGFAPRSVDSPSPFDYLYEPKSDSWRYIGGAIFSYQPKWVPGLFLGVSQSFTVYHDQMGNKLNDYLPFLGPRSRESQVDGPISNEEQRNRDRYASFHVRWVLPKGKAEFYAEYGRNESPWGRRDKIVEADHARAYVLGFRKLVPLGVNMGNEERDHLQLGIELTQLDKTRTYRVREYQSWYTSNMVRHGYTHLGQLLGAGIGPGSNVQSVNIAWLRGKKQLGLMLERQEQQTDLFYGLLAYASDYRRNWVNLAATINGEWDYRNFLFMAQMRFMNGLNFNYDIDWDPSRTFWDFTPVDQFNFQAQLGVMYRF
ncbi:hypothetical protein H8S90_08470 [Olivibacter sp. SDN3]|uniref:capsule assembly Wzi family protein n=1 Tax=Olivibacter sp. SDN3 TaxID=2764720 RepID=UPI0016511652|nr:capsule assembly Wzi family protein [Olivibacter sp. SDN3]QNL51590.1 hypothetical protein H8S90_08470 [Olivibacter sp. SDN3]